MNNSYPLSEPHLQMLNGVLESCPMYASVLQKCLACKLPAEEMLAKVQSQNELATNLKSQFFPDQP